ncbi:4'-phosphopantetheinyl transferase family protein [Subtercola boreus]|nr:4'-phosphopantetheinyl transferase superfamily protein [Subtercola boreus]
MWLVALYSEPGLDARPADPGGLTPGEVLRAAQLVDPVDRHRFVVSHHLLRLAVADSVGAHPSDVVLDFACERCGEQHGRPRVVAGAGPESVSVSVSISLSRSAGAALFAVLVAPAGERVPAIGVDLERIDAVGFPRFDDVALSASERASLGAAGLDAHAAIAARAALWVRKEAVAKAIGSGLRRDPRHLEVAGALLGRTLVDSRTITWRDVDSPLLPRFAAALAVEAPPSETVAPDFRTLHP